MVDTGYIGRVIHRKFYQAIAGGNYKYHYVDRSGVPGVNYTYQLVSLKTNPTFYSAPATDMEAYPVIQMVQSISASDAAYVSSIAINWTDNMQNHDGYLLMRGADTLGWFPKATMSHIDGLTSQSPGLSYSYSIRAYRDVAGTRYVSPYE